MSPFNDRVGRTQPLRGQTTVAHRGCSRRFECGSGHHKTHLDPVSGYERVFRVELAGTGTRVMVSSRVLDDRKDFAYVRCIPCSQSGYLYYTVTGSGTAADINRVIASIQQCLHAKHRHAEPQICSECENPISLVQCGPNRFRCKIGHVFELKAKATPPQPNVLWTHELVAVDGNHEACPFGDTLDADHDGNIIEPSLLAQPSRQLPRS